MTLLAFFAAVFHAVAAAGQQVFRKKILGVMGNKQVGAGIFASAAIILFGVHIFVTGSVWYDTTPQFWGVMIIFIVANSIATFFTLEILKSETLLGAVGILAFSAGLMRQRIQFKKILQKEKYFLLISFTAVIIIAFVFRAPAIAMWVGFALAAYSAISNDSIQTLGTFLSSNRKTPWWILWLFISSILVLTFLYAWYAHSGEVHFSRLEKIPAPTEFTFFQVFAPLILLVLTRFKVPVSTTFLILSVFATNKTIFSMVEKSLLGYALAFLTALFVWTLLSKYFTRIIRSPLSKSSEKRWRIFQWITTAFLWMSWLMQDTANIVVFLPRVLSFEQFLGVIGVCVVLLGVLFRLHGGRIQEIVTEKKDVLEPRAAAIINVVFTLILIFFKELSTIPMSTTWVFLGLLAGREIVLSHFFDNAHHRYQKTLWLVLKDASLATLGIGVSIILVILSRI